MAQSSLKEIELSAALMTMADEKEAGSHWDGLRLLAEMVEGLAQHIQGLKEEQTQGWSPLIEETKQSG